MSNEASKVQEVEFLHAGAEPRPVRLSPETRLFAWESLNGRYGRENAENMSFAMDDIPGFGEMSEYDQYDLSIERIAERAPIRICEGELLSGAATMGLPIYHRVPTTYKGEQVFFSVSHLTVDFPSVIRNGVADLERQVAEKLAMAAASPEYALITPDQANHRLGDVFGGPTIGAAAGMADVPERRLRFWQSCDRFLKAFRVWHGRYIDALEAKAAEGGRYAAVYAKSAENLRQVPFGTPRSFHEALQSIWMVFAFLRLCGNWPGFGRIDWMLGPFLEKDLADGTLTLDEARELMGHFFIKGCEWVGGGHFDSGDAQHYQNLVLAGIDPDGKEVTNAVTYLVLDILEETGIADFPTSVRLNENTPEELLARMASVTRFGGGALAAYGEKTIIEGFLRQGYELSEARSFANDGCWEVQVPGKTFFRYSAYDSLKTLTEGTLRSYSLDPESIAVYESYDSFEKVFEAACRDIARDVQVCFDERAPYFTKEDPQKFNKFDPCTAVSVFEQGCIDKGLNYWEGGPRYVLNANHIGGMADMVNALYAIKKLVFDEKKVTMTELIRALAANWEGYETLQAYARTHIRYFGNDNEEVDELANRCLSVFAAECRALTGRTGYRFPAGISTFGRQIHYAEHRLAVPHGYKKGAILAPNASPTPGTDTEGATAIIKSYCRLPLADLPNGAALDLRLLPTSVEGEEGLEAIASLYRAFALLGGSFLQIDVLDAETLRRAQENPDDYRTLSVRVSGWNARFVTLSEEWQNGIILQAETGIK